MQFITPKTVPKIVVALFCSFYCTHASAAYCPCGNAADGAFTYDFDYLELLYGSPANWNAWFDVFEDSMVNGIEAESSLSSRCCTQYEQHPFFQDPSVETYNSKCLVVSLQIPTQFLTSVDGMYVNVSNESEHAENHTWFESGRWAYYADQSWENTITWCNGMGTHSAHSCSTTNYSYPALGFSMYGNTNFTDEFLVPFYDGVDQRSWNNYVDFVYPDNNDGLCEVAANNDDARGANEYLFAQLHRRDNQSYY